MKFKFLGLLILLSIFLIGTSVFAAQYNFTPRVTARETYSDNIFLTDSDKDDDFITDVSAGGTFSILDKTSGMNFAKRIVKPRPMNGCMQTTLWMRPGGCLQLWIYGVISLEGRVSEFLIDFYEMMILRRMKQLLMKTPDR